MGSSGQVQILGMPKGLTWVKVQVLDVAALVSENRPENFLVYLEVTLHSGIFHPQEVSVSSRVRPLGKGLLSRKEAPNCLSHINP